MDSVSDGSGDLDTSRELTHGEKEEKCDAICDRPHAEGKSAGSVLLVSCDGHGRDYDNKFDEMSAIARLRLTWSHILNIDERGRARMTGREREAQMKAAGKRETRMRDRAIAKPSCQPALFIETRTF
jgi:hypothetical protein